MNPIRGRRIVETEIVPAAPSPRSALLAVLALLVTYVAVIATAAARSAAGLAMAAVAVVAVEVVADRRQPIVGWALRRVGCGDVARSLARGLAVAVFAARATPPAVFVATVIAVTIMAVAAIARVGGAQVAEFARVPAVVSRDLPLPPATDPADVAPAPVPELLARPGGAASAVEGIAALGLALSVRAGSAAAYLALAVAVVIALAGPVAIAADLRRLGGSRYRRRSADAVGRALGSYRPDVVAYLGNGVEWRYQLEMWLAVLESLPQRVLIVVRDLATLQTLAPSTIPVVCVPRAVALMQLPLPAPRAVLYVGNAADNVHFLRRTGTRTVFIGHGDSDKRASANPFTRVYDEVWVAGEAGRDRYRRAGVDIADGAFAYVGRPQLPDLPRLPDQVATFTVLYAPTWEGWNDEDADCSLPAAGVALVDALLAAPGVRVMYRPHPATGYRDPVVRRAHAAILERLRIAGATPAPAVDAATMAPAAVQAWAERYWAQATGHRVLTQPAPDLHACFRRTDLLVADVSSVVTDWLATDRPYAVVNATGRSAADFRQGSASARGGFVLDADPGNRAGLTAELDAVLDAVRTRNDPTTAARTLTRHYVLGPRTADPAETFRRNIDRLCRRPPSGHAAGP